MPKKITINLEEWKEKNKWVEKPLSLSENGKENWEDYKKKLEELMIEEFGQNKEAILHKEKKELESQLAVEQNNQQAQITVNLQTN